MDLSNPVHSFAFICVLFSALITLAIAISGPRSKATSFKANSELPPMIASILSQQPKSGLLSGLSTEVPWSSLVPVSRERLLCKAGANCEPGSAAFIVPLPPLQRPGSGAAGWDDTINTWHLSTQSMMRTGFPTVYPVATVIVVPADTPSHVTFIVDSGIGPMIKANGSLLNMGSNWRTSDTGQGLDITGNNASSFVIANEADHDVFFAKSGLDGNNIAEYWIVPKGQKVLMWQVGPYWSPGTSRSWNAKLLPSGTSDDFAAYLAETMMYSVLGPMNPI